MTLITLLLFWLLCLLLLWGWKSALLRKTWGEPYVGSLAVLLESDDWGPGGEFHQTRFEALSALLLRHTDSQGRPAVLTADMVLSVPDTQAIRSNGYAEPIRCYLDQGYQPLLHSFKDAMQNGTLVPQLHGIEHLNLSALTRLGANNDARVSAAFNEDDWWDWETLDSPLQGHYVDGSALPTTPLTIEQTRTLVQDAVDAFQRIFGIPSISTVAPCYLWDEQTEQAWAAHGIRYIQTAGYRCPGRSGDGTYQQDLSEIRVGDDSGSGQLYLLRNAMYEPVDGRKADGCLVQAMRAYRQGLPVVISTHRYNYTRSETECNDSLQGLDQVLTQLESNHGNCRYLSSAELGGWLETPEQSLTSPANQSTWPTLKRLSGLSKLRAFLLRLWYRHAKLRVVAIVTGLIIPGVLVIGTDKLLGVQTRDG